MKPMKLLPVTRKHVYICNICKIHYEDSDSMKLHLNKIHNMVISS